MGEEWVAGAGVAEGVAEGGGEGEGEGEERGGGEGEGRGGGEGEERGGGDGRGGRGVKESRGEEGEGAGQHNGDGLEKGTGEEGGAQRAGEETSEGNGVSHSASTHPARRRGKRRRGDGAFYIGGMLSEGGGADGVETVSGDGSRLYDKVLVDAECTHDGSIKHLAKFEQACLP